MTAIQTNQYPADVLITGEMPPQYADILTPEAISFLIKLESAFGGRRSELLELRRKKQEFIDSGQLPDFCLKQPIFATAIGK